MRKPLLLSGFFMVFIMWWDVFAQTVAWWSADTSITNWINFFNLILNVIYIFIWPLLFITGYAMDNSMIYGSFIWLDAPLWKFWNLTKNIANFALGFLVLWEILKYVFSFGSDYAGNSWSVQKTITNTMIAGVGIQVSWFVLAALIDISTIVTASVGGLPMNILRTTSTLISDRPILMTHGSIDLNSSDPFNQQKSLMYYSFGNKYFAPCQVRGGYIVWPMELTGSLSASVKNNMMLQNPTYCIMQWYVVNYQKVDNSSLKCSSQLSGNDIAKACTLWPREARVIQTSSDTLLSAEDGKILTDVVSASQGFVGPLVTLYSTLLNFWSITQAGGGGTVGGVMIEFLLKSVVGLLLLFPLIALCGVMLWRILNLWMVIALTPLYILKYVFWLSWLDSLPAIWSYKDLLWLIFAPVLPVLAISLSVVFLTVIQTTMQPWLDTQWSDKNFLKAIGITALSTGQIEQQWLWDRTKTECWDYVLTKMCFSKADWSTGDSIFLNFVNRLVLNIIAIGLMWTIVFAALGSLSFAKKIVETIKSTGESLMWGIPLIPLPGGGKVGLWSVVNGRLWDTISNSLDQKFSKNDNEALSKFKQKLEKSSTSSTTEYKTGVEIKSLMDGIDATVTDWAYGKALWDNIASIMNNPTNTNAIEEYIKTHLDKDTKLTKLWLAELLKDTRLSAPLQTLIKSIKRP